MNSVRIVLFDDENNLFLQRRDDKEGVAQRGKVTLFGGGIEDGELPIDAAIRELGEELTISADGKDLELIGEYKRNDENIFVYRMMVIKPWTFVLKEGQEIVKLSKNSNLDHDDLSTNTRRFIESLRMRGWI